PFIALIAVSVGLYRAARSAGERRRLRRVLQSSPALLASAREGEIVRVTGKVRPIELLTAPLSGRTCVMYRARVDNVSLLNTIAPARKTWDHHIAASITPFLIDRDDGAPVMINGQAIVELPPEQVTDDDRKRRFLLAHGVTARER